VLIFGLMVVGGFSPGGQMATLSHPAAVAAVTLVNACVEFVDAAAMANIALLIVRARARRTEEEAVAAAPEPAVS
jgi:hypothetical protein